MALKPLKPCRKPGCCVLTREAYCPEHKPRRAERRESEQWHSLYSLPVWKYDLRPSQLLREPFCRSCTAQGKRVRATVADHIVPHRGDMSLFTDRNNLQSLCEGCHNRKTAKEMAERAGKTSKF